MIRSLRAKLAFLLLIALLPTVAAVAWLLLDSQMAARNAAIRSFVQTSEMAAMSLEGVTRGATRVALAYVDDERLADPAGCQGILSRAKAAYPDYSGLSAFAGNGLVCEAMGSARLPPHATEAIVAMPADGRPLFGWTAGPRGPVMWTAVKRAAGTGSIAMVVLIGEDFVRRIVREVNERGDNVQLARLDGTALDPSGTRLPSSVLGAIREEREAGDTITAVVDGRSMIYSIQRRPALGVAVVVGAPWNNVVSIGTRQMALAIAAPILLLIAAVTTLWVGLDQLVLRWLSRIQRVARSYAAGGISARCGPMPGAPDEIVHFARAFDGMADSIAERTVDLEGEIDEKRRYIRELHHRVKNNLQVLTSMLALQRRHLPESERPVLRFPEDRVNALSAAYRAAYAHSEVGDIDAAVVITDVIARLQVGAIAPDLSLDVDIAIGDALLNLDRAVALAMLLAELLPPRFDRAARSGNVMTVRGYIDGESMVIDVPAEADGDPKLDALSQRFVEAYLRQLFATMEEVDGRLRVRLPIAG